MNHAEQLDRVPLTDSYESDELSGVRQLPTAAPIVVDDPASEPVPVHVTVRTQLGPRRYYVGVRFETGVIPVPDWERAMQRDGIGAAAIRAARAWLSKRAL